MEIDMKKALFLFVIALLLAAFCFTAYKLGWIGNDTASDNQSEDATPSGNEKPDEPEDTPADEEPEPEDTPDGEKPNEPEDTPADEEPEPVVYSKGLEFISNEDGTCYLYGVGSCTDTEVKIPPTSPEGDRVTAIGKNFAEHSGAMCAAITKVVIPEGVTVIGIDAFSSCESLVSVTLPNSLEEIGDNAFSGTAISGEFIIPDNVTVIRSGTFFGCDYITSFVCSKESRLKTIEAFAFCGCESLERFIFGDAIEKIDLGAFSGCLALVCVYYTGSYDDWANVDIYEDNDCLIGSEFVFNYAPQS